MRIDGLPIGQLMNTATAADILSRLNIGDVIRAQILEFTTNEVLLKLFDGTTMKAATMSQIDAKQGDFVDFTVKSKLENQFLLETVKTLDKKAPENDIGKQLLGLGIKPDEKNLEIAKQIKLHDLPFTREIFDKIIEMVDKFKNLDPAKAAFLQSNKIAPEGENIAALTRFAEGKAQIGSNLSELLSLVDQISDRETLENISNKLSSLDINMTNSRTSEKEEQPVSRQTFSNLVANELKGVEKPDFSNSMRNAIQMIGKDEEFLNLLKSNDFESVKGKISQYLSDKLEGFENLNPAEKQSIADFIRDTTMRLRNRRDFSNNPGEAIDDSGPSSDPDKVKNMIHKSFENVFAKIDSDTQDKDINVKSLYKELYGKLEAIKDAVGLPNLQNGNEIINKIDQMQNNIKFLNELNNYSTYVQIPLTIQGQNTTGDLYILKRNSARKKIDPENTTLLLSLSTVNIGQVDSLITVNKKNISVSMRVEDQEVFEIIREGYKDLYNRLAQKGYKLVDLKYKLQEDRANILNVKEIVKREEQSNKMSIDYRI